VSALPGEHRLIGDASLSQRPMDRVAEPLTLMGARIEGQGPRLSAPLRVVGTDVLRGIAYDVPMASAQVKSAILFAALAPTPQRLWWSTCARDLRPKRCSHGPACRS